MSLPDNSHKLWRTLLYISITLLLEACSPIRFSPPISPTIKGVIDVQQAMDLAKNYCAQIHSQQEAPRNILAGLITCKAVTFPDICNQQPDDLRVWFITMDGSWLHWGPPPESGTPTPIVFKHCNVVINAQTGEMISISSK